MYENLTEFEKCLGNFADKVEIIVGLEIGGKITSDDAYKRIKEMMKELKKIRKHEKNNSENTK